MAALFTGSKFSATDASGNPLAGGKVWTYAAGTLTPKATYTTQAGDIANANPVELDSTGRANIWLTSGAYKFVVTDSTGATAPDGTVDNITAPTNEVLADLANVVSASKGPGLVGFGPTVAYATGTVGAKLRESVSLTDFGAIGNGAADCGPALQAAHDALPGVGGVIRVPACASVYLFQTGATFTKYVRLIGDGVAVCPFYTITSGITLIEATAKLDIENISFLAYGAARETAVMVKHLVTSAGHNGSTFRNNTFDGGLVCYYSERTNSVHFDGNRIGPQGAGAIGLLLENQINSDEGDSFFTNNSFSGGVGGTISLSAPTTAGLYLANNKFNGAATGHVLIACTTHDVGNNIFTGNSFEGHTDYGVNIVGTTGISTKNLFTGNQFSSNCNNHIVLGLNAQNNTVVGNTFNSTSAALSVGVLVQSGSRRTTIVGNEFYQMLTAVSAAAGVGSGISMSGNHFGEDVTNIFSGDDTVSLYPSQREISLTRFVSTTSAVTYTDAIKVVGNGIIQISVHGTVTGVGPFSYHRRCVLVGTTLTDIDAAVTGGAAVDVQTAASGGYLVVSVRRNSAGGGTTLQADVEVTARGRITGFLRA